MQSRSSSSNSLERKKTQNLTQEEKNKSLKRRRICGLVEGCDTIEGY